MYAIQQPVRAAALAAGLLAGTAAFASPGLLMVPPDPEAQVLSAIEQLQYGRLDAARSTLALLTRQEPNFRLAQYLHGTMLAARSGQPLAGLDAKGDALLADLIDEAQTRLSGRVASAGHGGLVPDKLLTLPQTYRHAVVVDLKGGRLYVMENTPAGPRVVRDVYATIGRSGFGKQVEGDGRTPIGIYRVTSFIEDGELPTRYGHGAYPVSYPNTWDKNAGRTGYGIWMHGVPHDTYSRPPLASEGCVAVSNADFDSLEPYITLGDTPVILADEVNWITPTEASLLSEQLFAQIRRWEDAWEAMDTDAYLSFYASDFRAGGLDLPEFAAHKYRVNAAKTFVDVELSEQEAYRYPDPNQRLYLVRYRQEYRSSNFNNSARKEQFWRLTDAGRWEIVAEDTETLRAGDLRRPGG